MIETFRFFNPPSDEKYRVQYLHGYMDGCKAGGADMLDLIARLKAQDPAKSQQFDPELERRRQLAEAEILEAEVRIRKALAETREFYAQRRKPAAVPWRQRSPQPRRGPSPAGFPFSYQYRSARLRRHS